MKMKIGVVGLWHLGCVLTACWYKLGHNVIGFDHDEGRSSGLGQGEMPLYEPELEETIVKGIKDQQLSFTSDIRALNDRDVIFLSYDTPVGDDDTSDTAIIERSVAELGPVMKDNSLLVVSSQSPVGLCHILRRILKDQNDSLGLAYSPENIRLGEAIHCYLNTERIILGAADNATQQKGRELFAAITDEVVAMSLESAEMVKHGINSFLANSIVFANHLKDICDMSGASVQDVVEGMKLDPRNGSKAYLSPGIGFSGGTLGRDLKVLDAKNEASGGDANLFGVIHQMNQERKYTIAKRIEQLLASSPDKRVGILGLTYKPGTSTLRRSLPLEIVQLLLDRSFSVTVYDPKADYSELDGEPAFTIAQSIEEAAASADILVLLTEWEDFKVFDWKRIPSLMNKPLLYDTKDCLNEKDMLAAGFIVR